MKSYEVTLQKVVTYYQLITIEDAASQDDAIEEAYDMQNDDDWEFACDDYDLADIQEIE